AQYLLGNLPRSYLTTLRAFHGLQAYPSRTKDPDPVDFSTGSVGLGAVAPVCAALVHQYARQHFGTVTSDRFIAVVGDAELDEGNVWEAVTEDAFRGLGNVLWIVDLNRQSLDRIVPGIRAAQLKRLFRDSQWHVTEAKYGRRLQALFNRPGGETLRKRIDDMSNEEYQSLLRQRGEVVRERLVAGANGYGRDLRDAIADVADDDLPGVLGDLGGHDLVELLRALNEADAARGQPSIVFAYTIKGWGLPIAGDPLNHSALLTETQMRALRVALGAPEDDEWAAFPPDSPEGRLCQAAAERRRRPAPPAPQSATPADWPAQIETRHLPVTSSQDAFGRLLGTLARRPELRERVVTVSPDVSISTSLGAWINRVGVYAPEPQPDYWADLQRLVRWKPGPEGQHIELGISEMNLFMLLSQLGLAYEQCGQHLVPIGTVYDPFICRGLDALIYGLYSGAQFIVVGTPSGVSLSPEGGAHQSSVTPSLGIELPNLDSYEPCFAREVEWILMAALRRSFDRDDRRSTYLRLTTKPVDQRLLDDALARYGEEELRRRVLGGGYRLLDWRERGLDADTLVHIATTGAMVPEAVAAAEALQAEGIAANVINITSPGLLYRELQAARRAHVRAETGGRDAGHLDELIRPAKRRAPIVTVHDAASHALAFLGAAFGQPVVGLGVDEFGQSGTRGDLYRATGIDVESVVRAVRMALDLPLG
ncbi:MAG: pyruvate dehydrogenase, partial [Chloroflexi bacterium]|nr:pyruvate dehydrogenase [Chloroflexota bacterium]